MDEWIDRWLGGLMGGRYILNKLLYFFMSNKHLKLQLSQRACTHVTRSNSFGYLVDTLARMYVMFLDFLY